MRNISNKFNQNSGEKDEEKPVGQFGLKSTGGLNKSGEFSVGAAARNNARPQPTPPGHEEKPSPRNAVRTLPTQPKPSEDQGKNGEFFSILSILLGEFLIFI